jgi:hypothetical protein
MIRGQQKKIRAPGVHPPKRHECAATDWRTGNIVRIRTEKRNAAAFCRLVGKCIRRSARRKRRVIIVTDGARIHTPEGSKQVAELLQRYGRRLKLRSVVPSLLHYQMLLVRLSSRRLCRGDTVDNAKGLYGQVSQP